jgi:transcriptional regulator with XRE-family HTH domain
VSDRRRHLKALKKKKYRDAYISEQVRATIAFQLKAMREQRLMTQEQFAMLIGVTQGDVSKRLENPTYDTVSLKKLIEISQALDVALLVRFMDYAQFLPWTEDVSDSALGARPIQEVKEADVDAAVGAPVTSTTTLPQPYRIVSQSAGHVMVSGTVHSVLYGFTNTGLHAVPGSPSMVPPYIAAWETSGRKHD